MKIISRHDNGHVLGWIEQLFLIFISKTISLIVLFLLIGVSIIVAGAFLTAFLWSVRDGQYEDDYTPSVRILFDETEPSVSFKPKQTIDPKITQIVPKINK